TYEGEQLGQGRENAKSFFANNPVIMAELTEKVMAKVSNTGVSPTTVAGSVLEVFE
ncbi:MAG: DNA recombination/repair protein RecA, partial [Acidimicrobiaceae bacterium]|nr:DNA recombination/repair protein RecA [Acidimicrobiaceae bacterium]